MLYASSGMRGYAWSVAVVAMATAVAWPMFGRFQASDLALIYLLATVVVATRFGRGPSLLATTLGIAVFDFCFVPPYFSFAVRDDPYLLTFAAMLVVGLTVSTLAIRAREQAEAARSHARWTATLHALTRDLAEARDPAAIAASTARHVESAFSGRAVVLLPGESGALASLPAAADVADERERDAARRAYEQGVPVTRHSAASHGEQALYLPLRTATRTLGVLGFRPAAHQPVIDPGRRQMLEALAQQVAGALERSLLAEEAKRTELRARTEELRNALLSSVSHDLRTPLAAIMGSATTLLDGNGVLTPAQADLARTVYEEAERLNRLVANLLAMTRVESGDLAPRKEWVPLEEVVGAALERLGPRLEGRPLRNGIPADLPLVAVDPVLIEQVLVNLLENAVRYTPAGTPIGLSVTRAGDQMQVEVFDEGAGLAPGVEGRVFEKFFRGPGAGPGGSGLGLAICRGIVAAHGGSITAGNRAEGGASFRFTLPLEGQPPPVPEEEAVGS
jgi:two-component system sensor histidine kinase KdpD